MARIGPAQVGNEAGDSAAPGQLFASRSALMFRPKGIDNADAVAAEGQTISLPQGSFTSIDILGTATGGTYQTGTFTVNYLGGGTATFTQSFSDWVHGYNGTGGTTAPGESIAVTMTSYNTSSANTSGHVYLYGYVFSTSTTEPIVSIKLPNNSDIKILAIDEVNAAQQADPEDGVIEGDAMVAGGERDGTPVAKGAAGCAGDNDIVRCSIVWRCGLDPRSTRSRIPWHHQLFPDRLPREPARIGPASLGTRSVFPSGRGSSSVRAPP